MSFTSAGTSFDVGKVQRPLLELSCRSLSLEQVWIILLVSWGGCETVATCDDTILDFHRPVLKLKSLVDELEFQLLSE